MATEEQCQTADECQKCLKEVSRLMTVKDPKAAARRLKCRKTINLLRAVSQETVSRPISIHLQNNLETLLSK